jgi:uncharacterized protein (TIGR00730 family)
MSPLRRLAVFAAASDGNDPALRSMAYDVGAELARRGIGLVYGAGGAGLMGALSQGALDAGGEVIGVIPEAMIAREWGRHDLTRLRVVATMHERKAEMAALADAFLAIPGGLGTLEEIVEVWSWSYLGIVDEPVGFLNVGGFWDPFLAAVRGIAEAGFIRAAAVSRLVVAPDLDQALAGLESLAEEPGPGPASIA